MIGHADHGRRGVRLLVADGAGPALRYRGVVELGLARDELWEALATLERPGCPLPWAHPPRGVTWVAPELEVEVSCHGKGGELREATVRAVYPGR